MAEALEDKAFEGAKLALFIGAELVVIERDHSPGIAWPGHLDLPGGGREGDEDAIACVLRETREELGLAVPPGALVWRRFYERPVRAWFFAAHMPMEWAERVVFGDEGLGWRLMPAEAFVRHTHAVPHFADRVDEYLREP